MKRDRPSKPIPIRGCGGIPYTVREGQSNEHKSYSDACSLQQYGLAPLSGIPQSVYWPVPERLYRGGYGACVGFTWAHALSSFGTTVDDKFAIESIYWEAQRIDCYSGGSYPGAHPISAGTSVRAGAQVVQRLGLVRDCLWLQTTADILAAVAYIGPVVFGCEWHRGMSKPDQNGFVLPSGGSRGRHCVLLNQVHIELAADTSIDQSETWFGFVNSFGPEWGQNGSARVRLLHMHGLMSSMEACVPLCLAEHKRHIPQQRDQ